MAGGVSLSFAASDNWFHAIECFYKDTEYVPKNITYGKYVFRHYEDLIIDEADLL